MRKLRPELGIPMAVGSAVRTRARIPAPVQCSSSSIKLRSPPGNIPKTSPSHDAILSLNRVFFSQRKNSILHLTTFNPMRKYIYRQVSHESSSLWDFYKQSRKLLEYHSALAFWELMRMLQRLFPICGEAPRVPRRQERWQPQKSSSQ